MAAIPYSDGLPRFHPMTPLRRWADGTVFRLVHALSGGILIAGQTGSGKTSASARNLAVGYMAAGFGGVILCSKADEARQFQQWAREARREDDVRVIDAKGTWCYNFLNAEAARGDAGGGLTLNVVALLDELAQATKGHVGAGQSGEAKFWDDALRHLLTNLCDLSIMAGLGVSLPVMRSILLSAPQSLEEAENDEWRCKEESF